MAIKFLGKLWSFETRYGFGIDIEVTDSRPAFAVQGYDSIGDPKIIPVIFKGFVFSFPFFCVLIGDCYEY